MAYYLMNKKGKEYLPIDIADLSNFEKLSKFKDGYSLEEIDKFTSNYANEKEFKLDLYRNGLLDKEDINKEISIRRKNKGVYEKVTYGLVYNEASKYFHEDYLLYTIYSKCKDLEFLKKLGAHYRNSYINNENVSRIIDYVNYPNAITNIYSILRNFFIKEIYQYDKKTDEMKLKYKSLHDLAMFVYSYDNIMIEEKINVNELNEQKSDSKKRILVRKEEVEGQLTFKDML